MGRVRRLLPAAWATLLALLMLGPALGVGYVLTYDMVWVPDLAVRSDFWGLGQALPRAVPSDLVIALVDEIVPGMLLQKIVLVGALVGGGLGAAALAGPSLLARVVATSVYVWSPYAVERLWLGHWPVLLCWAVLPWLALAAVRYRASARLGAAIPLLLVVGSLSASAGMMSALVLLAVGGTRRAAPTLRLAAAALAANAPWVVAGLLHTDAARIGTTGVFAMHGEGSLPAPLTALGLGGVWNTAVVPGTRETVLPWVALAVLVPLALAGVAPARRRLGDRTAAGLAVVWALGIGLALWTWAAPGAVEWWAAHVPGGGLFRDGARSLALCAPLLAVLVAGGARRAASRLQAATGEAAPGAVLGVVVALVPLAVLPDAAWGISGQLRPATYPSDYAVVHRLLEDPPPGDLLVLPFTSYRAPSWNRGHRVLDPLPRYLQPDYVVSDELAVDGRVQPGEDPRTPRVLAALALPDAAARAAALRGLGIGIVVRELDAPTGPRYDADLAGTVLHRGPELELVALGSPSARRASGAEVVAARAAWGALALLVLLGCWNTFHNISRRKAGYRRER